jgi:hypothetical protein
MSVGCQSSEERATRGRKRKEEGGKTEEEIAQGGNNRPENAGHNRLKESVTGQSSMEKDS